MLLVFLRIKKIYFGNSKDSKSGNILLAHPVNGNYHHQTVIEEHYVIVGEPNGFYLSHVMPEDETGYKIARSVYLAIKATGLEQKIVEDC